MRFFARMFSIGVLGLAFLGSSLIVVWIAQSINDNILRKSVEKIVRTECLK